MVRSADPDMRWQATEILDTAKSMGLKVLRIWAFSDGPLQYNALQRYPGAAPQAGPFVALGYFNKDDTIVCRKRLGTVVVVD